MKRGVQQRIPKLTTCRELNIKILQAYKKGKITYSKVSSVTEKLQNCESAVSASENRKTFTKE